MKPHFNITSFLEGLGKAAAELCKIAQSMSNNTGTAGMRQNASSSFSPQSGTSMRPAGFNSQPTKGSPGTSFGSLGIGLKQPEPGNISKPHIGLSNPFGAKALKWPEPGNISKPHIGLSNPFGAKALKWPENRPFMFDSKKSPVGDLIGAPIKQTGVDRLIERGAGRLTGSPLPRFSPKGALISAGVGWAADKGIDKGLGALGWKDNPAAAQGQGTYGQQAGQHLRNTGRAILSGAAGGFAEAGVPGALIGGIQGGVGNIADMAGKGYQDTKELINLRGGYDKPTMDQQAELSRRLNANKARNAANDSQAVAGVVGAARDTREGVDSLLAKSRADTDAYMKRYPQYAGEIQKIRDSQSPPVQPNAISATPAKPITPQSVMPNPATTPVERNFSPAKPITPQSVMPNPATTPVERG